MRSARLLALFLTTTATSALSMQLSDHAQSSLQVSSTRDLTSASDSGILSEAGNCAASAVQLGNDESVPTPGQSAAAHGSPPPARPPTAPQASDAQSSPSPAPPAAPPTQLPFGANLPSLQAVRPYATLLDSIPIAAENARRNTPGQFSIAPSIGLDEELTDNVFLTNSHRRADLITTISLGLNATADTRHTKFALVSEYSYQKFLRSSDLDGSGIGLAATGKEELINDFLFLEANASVSDEFTTAEFTPATARPSGAPQTRVITYDVGPHITTGISDLADLSLRARYASVGFENLGSGPAPVGLEDATFNQLVGYISTDNHFRPYEMTARGEYLKQNGGEVLYNGLYSFYLGNSDGSRIVGRIGYESIKDPGITDLQGIIWSGGIILRPGRLSSIQVEYGKRYGKPTWSAAATVYLTPKLFLTGGYHRTFETAQARIYRSLGQIESDTDDTAISLPLGLPSVRLDLISGTFLTDDYGGTLTWLIRAPQADGPSTSLSLTGAVTHRVDTLVDERVMNLGGLFHHNLSRKSYLEIGETYYRTLESGPLSPETSTFDSTVKFGYRVTNSVTAVAGYAHGSNVPAAGADIFENVVTFSLQKTF